MAGASDIRAGGAFIEAYIKDATAGQLTELQGRIQSALSRVAATSANADAAVSAATGKMLADMQAGFVSLETAPFVAKMEMAHAALEAGRITAAQYRVQLLELTAAMAAASLEVPYPLGPIPAGPFAITAAPVVEAYELQATAAQEAAAVEISAIEARTQAEQMSYALAQNAAIESEAVAVAVYQKAEMAKIAAIEARNAKEAAAASGTGGGSVGMLSNYRLFALVGGYMLLRKSVESAVAASLEFRDAQDSMNLAQATGDLAGEANAALALNKAFDDSVKWIPIVGEAIEHINDEMHKGDLEYAVKNWKEFNKELEKAQSLLASMKTTLAEHAATERGGELGGELARAAAARDERDAKIDAYAKQKKFADDQLKSARDAVSKTDAAYNKAAADLAAFQHMSGTERLKHNFDWVPLDVQEERLKDARDAAAVARAKAMGSLPAKEKAAAAYPLPTDMKTKESAEIYANQVADARAKAQKKIDDALQSARDKELDDNRRHYDDLEHQDMALGGRNQQALFEAGLAKAKEINDKFDKEAADAAKKAADAAKKAAEPAERAAKLSQDIEDQETLRGLKEKEREQERAWEEEMRKNPAAAAAAIESAYTAAVARAEGQLTALRAELLELAKDPTNKALAEDAERRRKALGEAEAEEDRLASLEARAQDAAKRAAEKTRESSAPMFGATALMTSMIWGSGDKENYARRTAEATEEMARDTHFVRHNGFESGSASHYNSE